ncbi:rhodanese-like domain-containing protein [Helicobacter cetorum]|uniref:rhodanese-like domain-containing protein n=1 Tax=Helicobacter cetorum TaxID=138563 RepID=UPI000CF0AE2B|nr:rhodanese-like domain-containing protein [Helicobacter cetorum]
MLEDYAISLEEVNFDDFVVVDVRELDEYTELHLPNATLISVNDKEKLAHFLEQHKDKKVLLHCKAGLRALNAAKGMHDLGYKPYYLEGNVYDFEKYGFKMVYNDTSLSGKPC